MNFVDQYTMRFSRRFLFSVIGWMMCAQNSQAAPHLMPVRPKQCKIDDHLVTFGIVEAENSVELRAGWQAVLTRIHVNRGDTVKAGQLIAEVDTAEAQRYLEINEDYLALYLNQEKSVKNEIRLVKTRLSNLKPLAAKGIIASSEIDQFEQKLQQLQSYGEQYQKYREDLVQRIDEQRQQIKKANFYSPIDGIVSDIIVESRAMFGTVVAGYSARIAKIEAPHKYRVKAKLLDTQLVQMRNHQSASVHLPDGSTVAARIYSISPIPISAQTEEVNPWGYNSNQSNNNGKSSRNEASQYEVTIDFATPGRVLLPNLKARIEFDEKSNVVQNCLPWNSIQVVGSKTGVRKLDSTKGWQVVPVRLGRRGRHYVEVLKGVQPDDVVESQLW